MITHPNEKYATKCVSRLQPLTTPTEQAGDATLMKTYFMGEAYGCGAASKTEEGLLQVSIVSETMDLWSCSGVVPAQKSVRG